MATVQKPPTTSQGTREPLRETRRAGIAPWKWLCGLLMAYVCYGAFYIARGATGFTGGAGDTARIVFFHVPTAILSSMAYFVAAYYAIRLLTKQPGFETDVKSAIAMELGFLFCILATVTGSIFSHAQWGSYWNWDPRQTSILVMLLIYAAYLSLRGAVAENAQKRGRLCAVYVLVTLVPAFFLIWIVPRIPALASLHPPDTLFKRENTGPDYKAVLYPSFLAFILLFIWMFQLRLRQVKLTMRREQARGYNG